MSFLKGENSMSNHNCIRLAALSVLLASSGVFAGSATWTGGSDSNYATPGNWSPSGAPTGAPDIATFNNNVNTTVNTPATLASVSFLFDTANVGAFTIGTTATTLSAGSGWNVSTNATITTSQIFNPTVSLGARTGAGGISFSNKSATAGQSLTINGDITSLSTVAAGAWTLRTTDAGTKILNGKIADTAGAGLVLRLSGGTNQVNGINTFAGGTLIDGSANVVLGNSSALGTGAVSLAANGATLSAGTSALTGLNDVTNAINFINGNSYTLAIGGSQSLELAGSVNLASNAGTTAYSANAAQILNVTNSAVTTISGVVSGNPTTFQSGLTKSGAGILVLTNAYTYGGGSQGTAISGGTLLINNTTGSGTGASGVTNVNTGGTFGGNGITSGLVAVNSGGTFSPGPSAGATGIFTSTSTGNSALVLSAGSTTLFDIAGTTKGSGYDNFTTAGKVNYGGAMTINITTLPASNTVYDLFSFALVNNTAFSSISLTGLASGSLTNSSGVWTGSFGGNNYSFSSSLAGSVDNAHPCKPGTRDTAM